MRIGLLPTGQYAIIEGNANVLFQCDRLTDAVCVLEYMTLSPMSAPEKTIARQSVLNWDNERKAKQEIKAAKLARKRAKRKARKLAQIEMSAKNPGETDIEVPTLPEI